MKKTLIFIGLINAFSSYALSDTDYKIEFQKNYFQSCHKEMTTGADKVDTKTANKMCGCLSNKIVTALSVQDLKRYEKNPYSYNDVLSKAVSQCLM
jgi:hypothetical protein